ncbi:beta-lactamase-like protein [Kockovaella imperatae]|uniref:Beta-lactamase-like protein n=1 Tax=Kockovaella imperatae TaxID=4999 RepID=A0A1Y1UKE1_9TREE|nr:beta-lactamase-like protein [Kockovaella imperatae]ORX38521.1 beta-lactamase-like protein [Kockovaella imperatae]
MDQARPKPLPPVTIHFLGTSAGSGPTSGRNCSSLAVHFSNEIWLFDAADGSLNRLVQVPLRPTSITRIFITHLHGDHVLGLVAILVAALYPPDGPSVTAGSSIPQVPKGRPKVDIYGPRGVRKLVRTSLEITRPSIIDSKEWFAVHELLLPTEESSVPTSQDDLLGNEVAGRDLYPDEQGVWRCIVPEGSRNAGKGWAVHAGPIEHRVPSLGFILQEPTPRLPLDTAALIPLLQSNATALAEQDPPIRHPLSLLSYLTSVPPPQPFSLPSGEILHPPDPSGVSPRKIVIFGDCTGGTKNAAFREMCHEPSLLIHECTRAAVPDYIQPSKKMKGVGSDRDALRSLEVDKRRHAQEKALLRGHSSPIEVGEFAREIQPKRLILNHFSVMLKSPHYASTQPFPPILSPQASAKQSGDSAGPTRTAEEQLTATELQARLSMQSIADQVGEVWLDQEQAGLSGSATGLAETATQMIVPARDFMAITFGSHELSHAESEQIQTHMADVASVMRQWKDEGRIKLGRGADERWLTR